MSFDISQFKGIHHVNGKPERVWVDTNWFVEVPVGYSYSIDPETSGIGLHGPYKLNIQDSIDCDFSRSYSSCFNMVVFGAILLLTCNCDDMSSPEVLESLMSELQNPSKVYKCTRDILILCNALNEDNDYSSYNYIVVCRGSNIMYNGQILLSSGSISTRKKTVFKWLDAIGTLTEKERLAFKDYAGNPGAGIPTEFTEKTAEIDKGIRISIPKGFHSETDSNVIGERRRLVIVPNGYTDFSNPMEAPVALSVQTLKFENLINREDMYDTYYKFFSSKSDVFNENQAITIYKHSDRAYSLSQINTGDDCSKTNTILFTSNGAYVIHLIINYQSFEFNLKHAVWDIDHLAKAWLARIRVDGETAPDYPARGASPSANKGLPTVAIAIPDLELYPHYDQLGNTSVPKTDLGGLALIVTNAGGTEFESYPFSRFGGKLETVAERVISEDVCSKEYKQLVSTATTYSTLFRVAKDKFNPKEDRECDIRNLRMRRAYQLHVLRSFVWTLAEQAVLQKKTLPDFEVDDYKKIFTAIEKRKYLNYQAESHFPTLCGTADLHVFFVPDKTSKTDKSTLKNSGEMYGNIIPNSVASLDGLRTDLLALSATMEKMYQWLLGNRDYSKPLMGTAADALYAWCTMVLSAETPFFIEDGPMTCFYTQITEPAMPAASTINNKQKAPSGAKRTTAVSVQSNQHPDTFCEKKAADKKRPVRRYAPDELVIENGVLKEYSGSDPILVIPEGVTSIDDEFITSCPEEISEVYFPESITSIPEARFSFLYDNLKHIELGKGIKTIGKYCFCKTGLTELTIPGNVKTIGDDAFTDCKSLTCVTIENGVEIIGSFAFNGSPVKEVYIPESVQEIGFNAFSPETLIRGKYGTEAEVYSKKTPGRKYQLEGENPDDAVQLIKKPTSMEERSKPEDFIIEDGRLTSYVGTSPIAVIPKTVKVICASAFANSSVVKSINFENHNDLEEVEPGAFTNCTRLEELWIKGKQDTIYKNTVSGCPVLKSVSIDSAKIKTIENGAFSQCPSLEWISLPKLLRTASNEMISECPGFKRFRIDPTNAHLKTINGVLVKRNRGEMPKKHEDYVFEDERITIDEALSIQRVEEYKYKLRYKDYLREDKVLVYSRQDGWRPDITISYQQSRDWMFWDRARAAYEHRYAIIDLTIGIYGECLIDKSSFSEFWDAKVVIYIVTAKDRCYSFEWSDSYKTYAEAKNTITLKVLPLISKTMKSVLWVGRLLSFPELQKDDFKYTREELLEMIKDKPYSPDQPLGSPELVWPATDHTSPASGESVNSRTEKNVSKKKESKSGKKQKAEMAKSDSPAVDEQPEPLKEEPQEKNVDLATFEKMVSDLDELARRSILSDFENGADRFAVLAGILNGAKELLGDGTLFREGCKQYGELSSLNALCKDLKQETLDSDGAVINAIREKIIADFDRLEALREKAKADKATIRREEVELKDELSHLGLFKGKRKKEIAALLEEIPERIKLVEEEYEKAKHSI